MLLGTNDVGAERTYEDITADFTALFEDFISRGIKPIAGAVIPVTSADPRAVAKNLLIRKINLWMRDYCAVNRIPLVDYHSVLADPATGNGKASMYTDNLHPNDLGHYGMGLKLAEMCDKLFIGESILPSSALENIASGENLLDDPLITKTPRTVASGGVTGQVGTDTGIIMTNGTCTASVEPRPDGFGNDVVAEAILTGEASASYVRMDTTKTISFTSAQDCYLVPMFSIYSEGANILKRECRWNTTRDGLGARDFFMRDYLVNVEYGQAIGEPLYMAAGSTLTNVSLRCYVYGTGNVTVKLGRIMIRVIPADQYVLW